MVPGDCALSLVGTLNVLLHHVDERSGFDLYVPRSFGLALWDWLRTAAAEFGCRVSDG